MLKKLLFILLFIFTSSVLFSQKDSLKLSNGDIIIGKVKGMSQSVLVFKTNYSDSDFKITWLEVKEFYSKRIFIVSLNDGTRVHTQINTDVENKSLLILNHEGGDKITTKLSEIIFIDRYGEKFFSRLHAEFDLGISLRKAQNYQEYSGNINLTYSTDNWKYTSAINLIYNTQDDTEDISRFEIDLTAVRFLENDWLVIGSVDLLSNSDQNLILRATESAGGGYYFKNTNKLTLGATAGLAYNNETYSKASDNDKSSLESFVKIQINKYDVDSKLSITAYTTISPSITEKGRVRVDFNGNLKYKITSDFYIKTSLTYNFDNQPVQGTDKGDYTFQTTFGWDNN
jgi:hypothetical protein